MYVHVCACICMYLACISLKTEFFPKWHIGIIHTHITKLYLHVCVCIVYCLYICICLLLYLPVCVCIGIYMYVSACITRLNTVAINDFIASRPPPQQGSQWAKSWPTSLCRICRYPFPAPLSRRTGPEESKRLCYPTCCGGSCRNSPPGAGAGGRGCATAGRRRQRDPGRAYTGAWCRSVQCLATMHKYTLILNHFFLQQPTIHAHTCIYNQIQINTYIYIHIHIDTHRYILIHVYTNRYNTHTYIYVYIYTDTYKYNCHSYAPVGLCPGPGA